MLCYNNNRIYPADCYCACRECACQNKNKTHNHYVFISHTVGKNFYFFIQFFFMI